MDYLIMFSGEHATLPKAELEAVLVGEGVKYRIKEEFKTERLIVVSVKGEDLDFLGRLAYSKKAVKLAGSSKSLEVVAEKLSHNLSDKTFKVSSESLRTAGKLGDILHGMGFRVDVHTPDIIVECITLNKEYYAGVRIQLPRDFENRKPQHRPYFHPTSMHPKTARACVNLARVKAGDTVLDPFCGTGGILIEAGLMGMKTLGCDIDVNMVEGTKQNLAHYNLKGSVEQGDALDCKVRADSIVTDPPYGRASYVKGKDARKLYEGFMGHASSLLTKDQRMVLVAPSEYKLEFPGFKKEAYYDIRMHKSLTRRIWICDKK